ncbi:MAG: hypothetical protein FJ060_08845, partial [Cyanobacteria bacterium K_Offshore_0m_m2_072]|nr:hypothetical protein [Cyanobacteria bacterium K_Offshore_0m_m2_072]
MVRSPVLRLKPSLALPLLLGGFWASFAAPLRAQVSGGGLNTTVDGVVGGSCSTGLCQVTGGTVGGSNLFHRFSSFDTRGAITGVQIHNGGLPNVVVGVTAPLGSFIDKPVSLTAPGNLTWLSPGGIAVSGSGGFVNTNELTLSTATQQLVGAGRFDVFGTTPQQAALLSGTPGTRARDLVLDPAVRAMAGMAPDPQIVLNGVQLTVDRSLLVDNPGGLVSVAGSTLSAASATGQGGSISLTGPQVWVDGASSLLATGPTGGGLIQVGGSWQNSNADVRQAITTWVGSGALLDASATVQGDGGTIVVWSDIADPRGATAVAGTLRAQGGPDGGNGGQVETSGAWLGVNGIAVSTLAPRGTAGTWLLDPDNLIVSTDTTTAAFTSSSITYTANSSKSYVNIGDINNSLPFSNVTLLASNDITIDSSIFYSQTPGSAPGNLTLHAGEKIILNSSISLDAGSVDSPLVLKLQSGSGLWGAGSIELANGTASTASLIINQVGNSEYYGSIIGELNLVKQQVGRLSLFGTNSYSGGTKVEGGVLRAQSSSALGQASGLVSVSAGAAVELAGGIELQNNFNLSGTGVGNSGSLRNISEKNSISGVVTLLTQSTNVSSSSGSLTFAAIGSQESLKMGSNVTSAFQFVVGGAGDLIFNKA